MTTHDAITQHYAIDVPASADIVYLANHARASLAALYQKLGVRKGAEIGVWDGEHAEWLCQYNPQLELIAIDGWELNGVRTNHPQPSAFKQARLTAQARLDPYRCVLLQMLLDEAAALVPDRSLDFVFIDASHGYADVLHDLFTWSPKVRSGGIVSGHDYETTALGWPPENGVKQAVHQYLQIEGIRPLFLLMGTSRDRWKSYFWVQP